MSVRFELLHADAGTRARRGRLHTPHGTVETPFFMPVGTQATVKAVGQDDLRTLVDAFRLMPKNARETAEKDWPAFIAAVRQASASDADVWDKALAQDGGDAWLAEFLAAGPWVPEETE